MHVAIVHLDLGIGGAEKLIVSCARVLFTAGAKVSLYTSHHDPTHCFDDVKPGGLLGDSVHVSGDFWPRAVFGVGVAICAYLRMTWLACVVLFDVHVRRIPIDAIVTDGVPVPVVLFRWLGIPTVFYCHFPDKYLCVHRGSWLKRVYRSLIDGLEEIAMGCSDVVLVNSQFTSSVYKKAFPSLAKYPSPTVVYPVTEFSDVEKYMATVKGVSSTIPAEISYTEGYDHVLVSLNRYERKKEIDVAIKAAAGAASNLALIGKSVLLVIAGGYDVNLKENVDYFTELEALVKNSPTLQIVSSASQLGNPAEAVKGAPKRSSSAVSVVFRRSISNSERIALMIRATALLYTPVGEHFGIVPLEAMFCECPVIACNSGGPKETVVHGETGYLVDPENTVTEFTECVVKLLSGGSALKQKLGRAGKARVQNCFSIDCMSRQLHSAIQEAITIRRSSVPEMKGEVASNVTYSRIRTTECSKRITRILGRFAALLVSISIILLSYTHK